MGFATVALAQPLSTATALYAAQERLRQRENELLGAPLSQNSAAEITFLRNPTVTRGLAILGIDESNRLAAAHGPARGRTRRAVDVESRIERSLTINVLDWLIQAVSGPQALSDGDSARVRAAEEIGNAMFAARRAWIVAVAAAQEAALHDRALAASQASYDLARRMRRAGSASALDALRAERTLAEAFGRQVLARAHAGIERERLAHALGLWGQDIERIQLPSRLPDLPGSAVGAEGLEAYAIAERWDLHRLRAAINGENSKDPTRPRNASNAHDAGTAHGPLSLQLDELAVRARAEVRTGWIAYRAAFDLARHARDVVAPVSKRIEEEMLLRYNGMLVSVFALLADAAEQANVVIQALHADRDFWLTEVDLQQALAGIGIVHPGSHLPGRFRGSAADAHHAPH